MAPNYYNQDPDDNRSYQKTVAMCVAAASLVILLFLVVLYVNKDTSKPKSTSKTQTEEKKEDDFLKDSKNIKSSELEFWDDNKTKPAQKKEEEEGELTPYKDPSGAEKSSSSSEKPPKEGEEGEGSLNKDAESDEEYDKDKYIQITDDKGSTRYYEIMKDVPKNDYALNDNLVSENGMLTYKDNKRESVKGVDLSKYNGTVDFAKLKDAGIGFAMLRLGSRGYGTGKIALDEKFVEYAQNAQVSGISIGAYFYSQAVNETEAIEEANYIVGAVSGFNLKYPIAIDIEKVTQDEARTDKLTSKERTAIVKSFCDAVRGYGYKPIIYATKEMMITGLDIEELSDYDVWLSDETNPTDYPYRFSMWQYNTKGKIDGITGDIDLDISFIDYEKR